MTAYVTDLDSPAEVWRHHAIDIDSVTQLQSYGHSEPACAQPRVGNPPAGERERERERKKRQNDEVLQLTVIDRGDEWPARLPTKSCPIMSQS